MALTFKRAVKERSFLRLALTGTSGAGKTYTALLLATALAGDKPVAVVDTERGSASKYADMFSFDVLELDTYHPDRYIEAIQAAVAAGYGVVVIDSLSHAWNSTGGALELHTQAVKRQKTTNTYTAWADVTPIQNRLVDTITGSPIHVIATMRSKTEYIQDKSANGGTVIRKVGMAPIQRDGMEYEFDIFAELDQDHTMVVSKSRCSALAGAVIAQPGRGVADTLSEWLRGDSATAAPATETPSLTSPAQPKPQQPRQPQQAAQPTQPATTQASQAPDQADERVTRALKHETIGGLLNNLGLTVPQRRQEKLTAIFKQLDDAKLTASARAIMDALEAEIAERAAAAAAATAAAATGAAPSEATGEAPRIPYDLRDMPAGAGAH
jgi:AAA domain-containing protein